MHLSTATHKGYETKRLSGGWMGPVPLKVNITQAQLHITYGIARPFPYCHYQFKINVERDKSFFIYLHMYMHMCVYLYFFIYIIIP